MEPLKGESAVTMTDWASREVLGQVRGCHRINEVIMSSKPKTDDQNIGLLHLNTLLFSLTLWGQTNYFGQFSLLLNIIIKFSFKRKLLQTLH